MKMIASITTAIMEMCMLTCCMCMTFRTYLFDRFSTCEAKHRTA